MAGVCAWTGYLPLITMILFMSLPVASADVCSEDICNCWTVTPGTINYDCDGKQLTEIPKPLDRLTVQLSIKGNKITTIKRRFFTQQTNISSLIFDDNLISTVAGGAFDKLMLLTELHLKNNRLTFIDQYMFRHLSSLRVLVLAGNRITTMHRYSFFSLPSITSVSMAGNPLNCGCEERLIREFLEVSPQGRFLDDAVCTNLGNAQLVILPYSSFPACPAGESLFPPARSRYCYTCSAVSSVDECGKGSQGQCINQNAVCYTRIEFTNVIQVYGGCSSYANCIEWEKQNKNTCRENPGHVSCYVCSTDSLGNQFDRVDLMKIFGFEVIATLGKTMTPGLRDTSSTEYTGFTRNLDVQFYNHIYGLNGSYSITFKELRETPGIIAPGVPTVDAIFNMNVSTIWFVYRKPLMNSIESEMVGKYIQGIRITAMDVNLPNTGPGPGQSGCVSETTTNAEYGPVTWPATDVSIIALMECPYQLSTGPTKTASRLCTEDTDGNSAWANPNMADCPKADVTSRKLQRLADTDVTEDNVEDISQETNNLTDQWQTFSSKEVGLAVDIVGDILKTDSSRSTPTVIDNTLEIINDVLNVGENVLSDSEADTESSSKLVSGIDKFVEGIDVENSDYKRVTPNIAAYVTATKADEFQGLSMAFQASDRQVLMQNEVTYEKSEATPPSGRSGIVLPSTVFNKLSSAQKQGISKISSTALREPKLFQTIEKPIEKNITLSDNRTVAAVTTINSNVIGTSVPGVNINNLDEPVKVTFQHHKEAVNPVCVFWDVGSSTWKESGCRLNTTSESQTTCDCDHLTNFALLMDVYGTGGGLSEADKMALKFISYIGCGLSLIAIFLTLFTYLMFKKLRRDNPSKILMNLCLAIGFVDFVFLAGMQGYTSSSEAGCKIVAMLLHYFLLAALFWMAVEAFYMYLALVKVFDTYIARFQLKSSLFGWGIPLIIVIITASINKTDNYGIQPGGVCWLDRLPFFLAFLAPVCIVLILNSISFIMVLRQIFRRSSNKLTKTDRSSTMVRLRGAISLIVLLGLTWLFGILAVDNFGIVFHYLFAIFNTLQGFFIFIFYCLLKKEAQQCWRRKLPCLASPYEQTTSSGTNKGYTYEPKQNSESAALTSTTTKEDQKNIQQTLDLRTTDSSSEQTSTTKVSNNSEVKQKETTFRGNWQYNGK